MREALFLVKNGVPYREATEMEPDIRMAHVITFRQFEGDVFDWPTGTWVSRNA